LSLPWCKKMRRSKGGGMTDKSGGDQGKLPTPKEWATMRDTLVTLTKRVTKTNQPPPAPSQPAPLEPR